jgi:Mrp family chromosome partitioning ATPase
MLVGIVMFALLGSLAIPFGIEITNNKLRGSKQAAAELMLPVAARIPRVRSLRLSRNQKTAVSEQCARILQRVRASSSKRKLGSIGLLSCDSNCATGGLASQLAITAGTEYGLSTLLIDADYKLRAVSKMFRLNGAPGLSELIATNADFDDCIQTSKYDNVKLMTPQSKKTKSLPRLAHPDDIAILLSRFTHDYDLVILDLPINESMDGGIATLVDHVFVVVDDEKTKRHIAKESIDRLRNAKVNLAGLVLQGRRKSHNES